MALGPQFFKRDVNAYTEPSPPSSRSWTSDNHTVHGYIGAIENVTYEYRPKYNEAGAYLDVVHHGGSSITKTPNDYDAAWARRTAPGETIPLFEHEETAPYSFVSSLSGTKASRVLATKMLAIADVQTQREHGRSLISSTSLSPHSRRLVEHLQDAGAATLPQHTTNDMTFWDENQPTYGGRPVPEADVKAGSARLRSIVRQGRSGTVSPRNEQPRLPGMGG